MQEYLTQQITEHIQKCTDESLLDLILKLLIAEG